MGFQEWSCFVCLDRYSLPLAKIRFKQMYSYNKSADVVFMVATQLA